MDAEEELAPITDAGRVLRDPRGTPGKHSRHGVSRLAAKQATEGHGEACGDFIAGAQADLQPVRQQAVGDEP